MILLFNKTKGARLETIRVLVVDDFEPWRRLYRSALQKESGFQLIGEVADGLEAVQFAQQLQPDLILLDIGLPSLNGIEAAQRIREVSANSKILFVSEHRSADIIRKALSTGAGGYVVKADLAGELLSAIHAVFRGEQFVSASFKNRNYVDNAEPAGPDQLVAPLRSQNVECHNFRLYADNSSFVNGFVQSIELALENGNASVVLATKSHRSELLQKLAADGVDVDAAVEGRLLTLLDVADALSTFKIEAVTDENRSDGSARMPEPILEVVRMAKERHLHVEVG